MKSLCHGHTDFGVIDEDQWVKFGALSPNPAVYNQHRIDSRCRIHWAVWCSGHPLGNPNAYNLKGTQPCCPSSLQAMPLAD